MKLSLRDIITEDFQNEIQDSFATATGFGVVFVDQEGRMIGKNSNFCDFCRRLNESEEGACRCADFNKSAISEAKLDGTRIFTCHAGLINIEIPIIYNGIELGGLTAGNVRCIDEPYASIEPDSLASILADPELAKLYTSVPKMPLAQIEASAKALENITNYLVQNYSLKQMQVELAEQKRLQAELETSLNMARFEALEKQIMPHFIFNVLNSISRLISMKDFETAQEMLFAISQMLRYTCHQSSSIVALKDEISCIHNYITIQQIRFKNKLIYHEKIDDSILNVPFPFFVLQPIIENAIEHGILHQNTPGLLSFSCEKSGDRINITIADNGCGMSREKLKSVLQFIANEKLLLSPHHTGLNNSYKRLHLVYGDQLIFQIESQEGKGCTITISFPCEVEHAILTALQDIPAL